MIVLLQKHVDQIKLIHLFMIKNMWILAVIFQCDAITSDVTSESVKIARVAITFELERDLRSADKLLFCQPSYSTKSYGSRVFLVSAPCLWNKLPMDIKV